MIKNNKKINKNYIKIKINKKIKMMMNNTIFIIKNANKKKIKL